MMCEERAAARVSGFTSKGYVLLSNAGRGFSSEVYEGMLFA